MKGWRARIGFLVPPGNPTVEPEMMELAPEGVSLHFTRMTAEGPAGTHTGQEERNLSQVASVPACVKLLSMVSPRVIAMAHTATSYTLGLKREAELVAQMEALSGARFITAFGSVLEAFSHLGARRIAYATPYSAEMTSLGKRHLETCGLQVVSSGHLTGVRNIYEENSERAYAIARQVDHPDADVIFLSGVGMPTLDALKPLEEDTGKPVISAASAMMWHALRTAGVRCSIKGYGRLLEI
ncbi:maleate cis-trans isomerase family protein [Bradyrhizobium sp.]|jgi:maleate isomerase|uniref:maleate cis-trans isomerase family protein n=1 Tax=Bradyrhizobium sp. TaxID=376 RepID=UPI003BB1C84B